MIEADRIDYKLPLDPIALKNLCKVGRKVGFCYFYYKRFASSYNVYVKGKWTPVDLPEKSPLTNLSPYDYIYAKYEYQRPDVAPLYKKQPNNTIFR